MGRLFELIDETGIMNDETTGYKGVLFRDDTTVEEFCEEAITEKSCGYIDVKEEGADSWQEIASWFYSKGRKPNPKFELFKSRIVKRFQACCGWGQNHFYLIVEKRGGEE